MIIEVACSQDFWAWIQAWPISGKLAAELIATGSVSCSLKEHYFKKEG